MKIYIDFDDVICETAKKITQVANALFGIELPYREMQFFNLQKVFELDDAQYDLLMKECHTPECLLAYEETPFASETINKWVDAGHEVSVITGRPFNAYEPSRKWLDEHSLDRVPLYTVDKYGREKNQLNYSFGLTLEQFYGMTFDFAIEDSPAAFSHLLHFENCEVAVFDRPWNRLEKLPERFMRCAGWHEIDKLLGSLRK